jgi:hypothetical protein
MTSLLAAPEALFKDALRTVDKQLANVALAADALQRGRSRLPPVTSDFNEAERQSFISKTIGAIRDQVQRGLPVTSVPSKTLVRRLPNFFFLPWASLIALMIHCLACYVACLTRCLRRVQEMGGRY